VPTQKSSRTFVRHDVAPSPRRKCILAEKPLREVSYIPLQPPLLDQVATRTPIDPHAAVGRLVEAFEEVLDLSVAVPLSVLACNHHSGLAAPASGTDQPIAPLENGRFGALPSSHLGEHRRCDLAQRYRVRPDAGRLCTRRSAGLGPRQRSRASSVGRAQSVSAAPFA
jgi:hypothetical protein